MQTEAKKMAAEVISLVTCNGVKKTVKVEKTKPDCKNQLILDNCNKNQCFLDVREGVSVSQKIKKCSSPNTLPKRARSTSCEKNKHKFHHFQVAAHRAMFSLLQQTITAQMLLRKSFHGLRGLG